MLPPITTVNGEPLCATLVVQQMVQMCNRARTRWSYAINFVIADNAHYDVILGMTSLQKQDPVDYWDTGVWH
jgi:hypothetical protein